MKIIHRNGMFYVDFYDEEGERHRLTTGVKIPKEKPAYAAAKLDAHDRGGEIVRTAMKAFASKTEGGASRIFCSISGATRLGLAAVLPSQAARQPDSLPSPLPLSAWSSNHQPARALTSGLA